MVDIIEKTIQCSNALMKAGFNVTPIGSGDDPGNNVEGEDLFLPGVAAIDSESHAHVQDDPLRRLLALSKLPIGKRSELSQQESAATTRPTDAFK